MADVVDTVSYRFLVAEDRILAIVATARCTILPDG